MLPSSPLPRLRTPPNRHLPPSNPLSAPFGQMLALGNQTLMDRTGQHRDAVPADLIAEVLTGDADGTGAGRMQDIHIQVVPLFWRGLRRGRASRVHRTKNTHVLPGSGVEQGRPICIQSLQRRKYLLRCRKKPSRNTPSTKGSQDHQGAVDEEDQQGIRCTRHRDEGGLGTHHREALKAEPTSSGGYLLTAFQIHQATSATSAHAASAHWHWH